MQNKWQKTVGIGIVTLGIAILVPSVIAASNTNAWQFGNGAQGQYAGPMFGQRGGTIGTITAINGNTLTVQGKNGTTYTVDATSAKVVINGQDSTLSQLVVNDEVMVRGTPGTTGTNTITAQVIDKGAFNFGQRGGTIGTITAINGNTLTVQGKNGTTYTVDATSAQVLVDGQKSSLAFLAVNDEIHVRGTPGASGTNTITAQTIMKGTIMPKMMGAAAQITSINGNTLTFTDDKGTTYTVDATNAKVVIDGQDSKVSNLAANDIVLIQGESTGTNTMTAQVIAKGILSKGPGMGRGFFGEPRGEGMRRGMGMRWNQGTTTTTTNQ